MREGNQNDKIDTRRLAELLRLHHLLPVYHGEHDLRSLKELVRSYLTLTQDLGRVMTRVKAIYRSWAIPCTGKQVYAPRHRAEWLGKIGEPGVLRRAEFYYQQLDALRTVRQAVRRELLLAKGLRPENTMLVEADATIVSEHSATYLGEIHGLQRRLQANTIPPQCRHFLRADRAVVC